MGYVNFLHFMHETCMFTLFLCGLSFCLLYINLLLHGLMIMKDVEEATKKVDQTVEDSCDGVEGDDCLMRRTLAAHIDYIYTQKSKP